MTEMTSADSTALKPVLWLFLFFLSVYLLTAGGHLYSADTEIKALITEGLVERHSVALPKVFMAYMVPGRDGLSYAPFPIGTSLTMIPAYLIGDRLAAWLTGIPRDLILEFCLSLINQVVMALTCVVLFAVCRRLRFSSRTALATTLVFGLATVAWPYAKACWSEPQATLCVLVAFYAALRFEATGRLAWVLLAGGGVGYAITTKHEMGLYLFLITGLLGIYLYRRGETAPRRWLAAAVAYGVPLAFFGFVNLYYNYLRFGDWFNFGHYAAIEQHFEQTRVSPFLDSLEGIMVGAYQHLFSSGKSILLYSPPFMLFYWAMKAFWKTHRAEAWFCLAAPVLFFISAGSSWVMSFLAWGERYFVSLTPFLILPLSALIHNILDRGRRDFKKSLVALTAAGFCVQILAVSVNFQTTVDKFLARGERFDIQMMSYDPEYAPLYLHFLEFLSYFPGTWRLLTTGVEEMARTAVPADHTLTPADFEQKVFRDVIRYHTFDFWFLYMYFSKFPPGLIVVPLILLLVSLTKSGAEVYRSMWRTNIP